LLQVRFDPVLCCYWSSHSTRYCVCQGYSLLVLLTVNNNTNNCYIFLPHARTATHIRHCKAEMLLIQDIHKRTSYNQLGLLDGPLTVEFSLRQRNKPRRKRNLLIFFVNLMQHHALVLVEILLLHLPAHVT
jgi:hypothetical protein